MISPVIVIFAATLGVCGAVQLITRRWYLTAIVAAYAAATLAVKVVEAPAPKKPVRVMYAQASTELVS